MLRFCKKLLPASTFPKCSVGDTNCIKALSGTIKSPAKKPNINRSIPIKLKFCKDGNQ